MSAYQQALSTVSYINRAPEPLPGTRLVSFTVYDGIFHSAPATAELSLTLINDNSLTLSCGGGGVVFIEGSPDPVSLASQLTVVDLDHDHMIHSATINIANPQHGDTLSLDGSVTSDLQVSSPSNTSLRISGTASDDYYQVWGEML